MNRPSYKSFIGDLIEWLNDNNEDRYYTKALDEVTRLSFKYGLNHVEWKD